MRESNKTMFIVQYNDRNLNLNNNPESGTKHSQIAVEADLFANGVKFIFMDQWIDILLRADGQ